ncbi:response regulator receiver protein [candidate division KSB1 bacterium RBG_16_48_16]|nr:MAG: response regulator receiver protein [candidate division KSB1 bacterium RBG_16_48_16]
MQVLIADDDSTARFYLEIVLQKWGYEVKMAQDGEEAWHILDAENAPKLAILDWIMPRLSGVDVCKKLRQTERGKQVYALLLTAKGGKEDVVEGLRAGANDYVSKPVDRDILRARLEVGARLVQLQEDLQKRFDDLQQALVKVHKLQGLLPICSYCKKIRDDQNYWHQVEKYLSEHSGTQFSHGICPECKEKVMKDLNLHRGDPESESRKL